MCFSKGMSGGMFVWKWPKSDNQTLHRSSEHMLCRYSAALPIAACRRNAKGNMKHCLLLSDFIIHVSTEASGKRTDQRIPRWIQRLKQKAKSIKWKEAFGANCTFASITAADLLWKGPFYRILIDLLVQWCLWLTAWYGEKGEKLTIIYSGQGQSRKPYMHVKHW